MIKQEDGTVLILDLQSGHVADKTLSLQQVKEELCKIRGHLIDMPIDFLIVSVSPRNLRSTRWVSG